MRRIAVSWLLAGLGMIACGDDDVPADHGDRDAARVRDAGDGGERDAGRPDPVDAGSDAGSNVGAIDSGALMPAPDAMMTPPRAGESGSMRPAPTNTSFERAKRVE